MKPSDNALRGQTKLRAHIVEGPCDAIFSVDKGRITTWSRGAERLYGYTAHEAVGQMVVPLLWRSANTTEVTDWHARFAAEENSIGIEADHFCKDGVQIRVTITLSLLTDAARASRGLIISVRCLLEAGQTADQTQERWDDMGEILAFGRQKQKIASLNHQLETLELMDSRTGLFKRCFLDAYLDQERRRAARYGTPLSIIALHLDSFQCHHVTQGILTHSEVLQRIALLLQQQARTTDLVACYEEERFCVVLPHTGREGAMIVSERIRERIAAYYGLQQPVTVSIGAATFSHTMVNGSALIVEAEKALYVAKQDGGNRVIHFEATWDSALAQAGAAAATSADTTAAGLPMQTVVRVVDASSLNVSRNELAQAYDTTIECWSRTLNLRQKEMEAHSRRVVEMTIYMAQLLGIRDQELVYMRWGALLHDVGETGVPDEILFKPEPLMPEEWAVMRSHTTLAYEMLNTVVLLQPALPIPFSHHERWDGTGYPQGLQGEEIPLAARIFAIVDVWDALNSDRPYRKAWSKREALDYIYSLSGRHFDPRVVRAFHQMMLASNLQNESEQVVAAA